MDNSQELQSFLKQEGQKAMISQMVGKLTDQCRDKCIGGTPGNYGYPIHSIMLQAMKLGLKRFCRIFYRSCI
ncbi:Mitochondrial import inner membrane translocase subunit [Musa troglodytarum]|uniref:Mitochondrial import inner membrane translocase subunit n=1 Tax=Musa troglodytarum TaxID=320322 RepID=A0A9E7HDX5_9LILI|nr:Mitochondrial import inner membrane translocase subunit [Musa troglodytarum]